MAEGDTVNGMPWSINNQYGNVSGQWGKRYVDGSRLDDHGNPIEVDSITLLPTGYTGRYAMPTRTDAWNGTYKPTDALQAQQDQLGQWGASGYAGANGNYGGQFGRWQFSNSAPVSQSAPVGWGRYPGVGGAPKSAPWVTNPVTPGAGAGNGASVTQPTFTGVGGGSGSTTPAAPTGVTFPNWGSNFTAPSGGTGNPTPLTQGIGTGLLSNTQLGQAATPGAYAELVKRLGSETLANQYVNSAGGQSGGGNFNPAESMNILRATGEVTPPQWAWATYENQGLGKVVGGKWQWSDAMIGK